MNDKHQQLQNIWDGDAQDRKPIAENLIWSIEKYDKPVTVAIDGAFGVGKSYFVERLQKHLRVEGFHCVKYNAWESDYLDNPLLSLISIITEQLESQLTSGSEAISKVKDMTKAVAPVLFAGARIVASTLTAGATEQIIKTATDEITKWAENSIKEHIQQQKALVEFKDKLSNYITSEFNEKKRLIVIVDELDRCKPTFALQTLEIIKHLFQVKRMVFILATNMEQLAHTVRSVYGANVDGMSYLNRFISQHIILEEVTTLEYIQRQYLNIDIDNNSNTNYYSFKMKLEDFSYHLLWKNKIGLRNTHKIFNTFAHYYAILLNIKPNMPINLGVLFYFIFLQYHDYGLYRTLLGNATVTSDLIERTKSHFNDLSTYNNTGINFYIETCNMSNSEFHQTCSNESNTFSENSNKMPSRLIEYNKYYRYNDLNPPMFYLKRLLSYNISSIM
jgi:hypothetical protein